jgi:hypothetical protein
VLLVGRDWAIYDGYGSYYSSVVRFFLPNRFTGNTIGGTMNKKTLKNVERRIRSLHAGSGNVRRRQLVSLAKTLGRKESNRGKEPTYISIAFPDLRAVTIPSHPGTMPRFTVESILDQFEGNDVVRWQQALEQNPRGSIANE